MNNKNIHGYSLLEVIIVLAIIGGIMMAIAGYTQKKVETVARQSTTDALATEIAGMVKFVHEDEILTDAQNSIKNPLYDTASNAVYAQRTGNTQINDDVATAGFYRWDIINSSRGYFRDSRCGADGQTASAIRFAREYISCKIDSVLHAQEFRLERVDLVGNTTSRSIDRIDFFVAFYPGVSTDNLFIEKYINEIEDSFRNKKLAYSKALFIERKKTEPDKTKWALMKGNNTTPVERITLGQMADNLDKFRNNKTTDYGIRLSFVVGDGQYLKSDGSVGADKLCWNAQTKMSGPCLKGNAANDNQLLLSGATANAKAPGLCWDQKNSTSRICITPNDNNTGLEIRDGINETTNGGTQGDTATLMANVVIKDDKGELTTIPKVSYLSFKGNGAEIVQGTSYNGNITSAIERNGLIYIPLQTCPINPEDPGKARLFPRLSVAISSVVPESMDNHNNLQIDLTKESTNRAHGIDNVGKFGGVALQIDQLGAGVMPGHPEAGWAVTATTGNYDGNNGAARVYISPKSLSIVAFMWCSSVKQL
ncbi:prepilin-type N-terminal cleavage/methylation domain-containing protein [Citrobacter arsenatis]|uniref:pilus assembly FimT family protein n=1 Tax=Citrobacter arsenatis TaxID=2546350 RepID=UPI00300E2C75